MVMLEMHGVRVTFGRGTPILDDVSLRLEPGFYGLVGANGAGKTTLLRVIAGDLVPEEGTVRCEPRDATVVVCPQEVADCDASISALATNDDGLAAELRGRLDLDPAAIERWSSLSPGERKRWQIGAALAAEPDVLLLDEPTNHLDAEARAMLVSALRRFRGIGAVVSHDRALLEELPRTTLRVHHARVSIHAGAYSAAKQAWEHDRRAEEDAHARAKERVAAAATRLSDARREHAFADRARSSRTRMKDKNDHDGRSMGAKVVAGWAAARAGRVVGVRREEVARLEAEVPDIERDRTLGSSVFAAYARAPSPRLFHVDEDEISPAGSDVVVLRGVRVTIAREDRVRVVGPNGAGKTTLLAKLLRHGPPMDRLLHLPQELGAADVAALVTSLRALDMETRGRVMSVFAALGSDPERVLYRHSGGAAQVSPGEARKLALAMGLGRHVWALVLDEPTNHLDLPSIERLETALAKYPGAIVLVTHDDAFASACTTRVLTVREGAVV